MTPGRRWRLLGQGLLLLTHPLHDRTLSLGKLFGRAELQQLGPGVYIRTMPRRLVEGISSLVNLLMVIEDETHSSFDDIAPVRALVRAHRLASLPGE